ncbi:MAG: sulfatase-like hydrolase/transferase, partial [Muribaculaceae bacterium]|nr:sulfatase-like hydrolase/transferase [Muribaculaceae bacterium]
RGYPLVQALFRKAGYKVNLFDNQGSRSHLPEIVDFDVNYFINDDGIERQCFSFRNDTIFEYDGEIVDYSLQKCPVSTPDPTLTIYHLTGQHLRAEKRYPKEFARFTPADYDASKYTEQQRLEIAHYDNATLYLDSVLARIFEAYSGEEAVVLYMPDHGEEIHDFRNFYGRKAEFPTGQAQECLLHIPMIVYASPSYRERHPQTWRNITDASHTPWCNSYVAHQLLELAGISTPALDRSLLLFEAAPCQ